MNPQEFKRWIEDCIRNARINGMGQDAIDMEILEQARIVITRQMLQVASKSKGG